MNRPDLGRALYRVGASDEVVRWASAFGGGWRHALADCPSGHWLAELAAQLALAGELPGRRFAGALVEAMAPVMPAARDDGPAEVLAVMRDIVAEGGLRLGRSSELERVVRTGLRAGDPDAALHDCANVVAEVLSWPSKPPAPRAAREAAERAGNALRNARFAVRVWGGPASLPRRLFAESLGLDLLDAVERFAERCLREGCP